MIVRNGNIRQELCTGSQKLGTLKRYYELNTDLSPYGKSYNEWHTELEHGISLLETVLEHDDDLQREEFNMWLMKNLNYLR